MSSYVDLSFIDEEVICIYLWGIMEKRRDIRQIYGHTERYLKDWFPLLPSYGGFVQRLNRVADVFVPLIEQLQQDFPQAGVLKEIRLMNSMPICIAKAKHSGNARVTQGLANKGYCSSKDMDYYGVKLHVIGQRRPGTLPLSEYLGLTAASDHDLATFRQIAPYIQGGEIYLDKAYAEALLTYAAKQDQDLSILTPVKKKKHQVLLEVIDQWLSVAVSRVRQPIESLFNWIEEKQVFKKLPKCALLRGYMFMSLGDWPLLCIC